jgi:hypothetical protein
MNKLNRHQIIELLALLTTANMSDADAAELIFTLRQMLAHAA